MKSSATTVQEYLEEIPEEKRQTFRKLYETVSKNLPMGFEEGINYGMPGWSVPLATYPAGYHCAPGTALPFINLAAQKNFFALYHMGMYAKPELLTWFTEEFPKHSKKKPDMGKSCIRFKKEEDIPFELIAELCRKMSVKEWISVYESQFRK